MVWMGREWVMSKVNKLQFFFIANTKPWLTTRTGAELKIYTLIQISRGVPRLVSAW